MKILIMTLTLIVASPAMGQEDEERKEVRLTNREWTVLMLLPDGKGEAPIPKDAPIWNMEKGYGFAGFGVDQHRLGKYRIDGEFIIRDGWLRREFGNSALLQLPKAENFELEGLVSIGGEAGGWLMLVGWDIEQKSGYAIYNTRLRTQGSQWYVVEIKDGKPVADSEKFLVKRNAAGTGALRMQVDKKKFSLQAAGAYIVRDVPMPNYQAGHVAIGTFSPAYGAKALGLKSLRMKLK